MVQQDFQATFDHSNNSWIDKNSWSKDCRKRQNPEVGFNRQMFSETGAKKREKRHVLNKLISCKYVKTIH